MKRVNWIFFRYNVFFLQNEVNEFDYILLQKNVESYFLNAADFSYLFIFSEYVIFKTPILFVTSSTRKTTRHA